jgi:precorrin-2/cobalt-factor-2 C20-methyltransferase
VYVSKATTPQQRIVADLREMTPERGDCFAMIIVSRKERTGVLAGEIAPETALARLAE